MTANLFSFFAPFQYVPVLRILYQKPKIIPIVHFKYIYSDIYRKLELVRWKRVDLSSFFPCLINKGRGIADRACV